MTQQNTDGKFYAYISVAILADGTGRYRVSQNKFSELYNWPEDHLQQYVQAQSLPSRLVGPLTRAEYDALPHLGYAAESDPDAEVTWGPWRMND